MGSDNLYHHKKRGALKRRTKKLKEYKNSILIICEGEKTEPNYFKSFPVSAVNVKTIGTGKNTLSLVEEAIRQWKDFETEGFVYERLWCVFDKDDFPALNYNEAFQKIETEQRKLNRRYKKRTGREIKIKIAYSNEAFELWYLLHYIYFDTAVSRSKYIHKLETLMNKGYKKNDPEMYKRLKTLGETTKEKKGQLFAISNAEKLRENIPKQQCHTQNPSTTVDRLVEELNKYLKN